MNSWSIDHSRQAFLIFIGRRRNLTSNLLVINDSEQLNNPFTLNDLSHLSAYLVARDVL